MSSSRSGFTLVETMVAIGILTVAIAGPLYAAERAAAAAYASKDELTASYLAQEGIEYIRAMRDDAYLADYQSESGDVELPSEAWNDFLNAVPSGFPESIKSCRGSGVSCELDPTENMGTGPLGLDAIVVCGGSGCDPLYRNGSGIYTLQASGNTPTPFTRNISFTDTGNGTDDEGNPLAERVTVVVSWKTDNVSYAATTTDTLTPWQ